MRQFTCLTVGTGVLSRIATNEPVECNEIGYTVSSSPTFLLYDITINLTSISMYLCDLSESTGASMYCVRGIEMISWGASGCGSGSCCK